MTYKEEAKEIIRIALQQDAESALLNVLRSLSEESDNPATILPDIKQFIYDLIEEINCPEPEQEQEDEICEVYSRGVLDS